MYFGSTNLKKYVVSGISLSPAWNLAATLSVGWAKAYDLDNSSLSYDEWKNYSNDPRRKTY